MSGYNTKQRRALLAFLGEHPDELLTARQMEGALHMSCVKCGKTFHMADSNAALFAKHLAQNEQFTLDAADTILYGICSDCKEK